MNVNTHNSGIKILKHICTLISFKYCSCMNPSTTTPCNCSPVKHKSSRKVVSTNVLKNGFQNLNFEAHKSMHINSEVKKTPKAKKLQKPPKPNKTTPKGEEAKSRNSHKSYKSRDTTKATKAVAAYCQETTKKPKKTNTKKKQEAAKKARKQKVTKTKKKQKPRTQIGKHSQNKIDLSWKSLCIFTGFPQQVWPRPPRPGPEGHWRKQKDQWPRAIRSWWGELVSHSTPPCHSLPVPSGPVASPQGWAMGFLNWKVNLSPSPSHIHPLNLRWNPKMAVSRRKIVFQTILRLAWLGCKTCSTKGGKPLKSMPWPSQTGDFLLKNPSVPGVSSTKLKAGPTWAKMQRVWVHKFSPAWIGKVRRSMCWAFRFIMIYLGLESPRRSRFGGVACPGSPLAARRRLHVMKVDRQH